MTKKADTLYTPFAEIDKQELSDLIKSDSYITVVPDTYDWFKRVITEETYAEFQKNQRITKLVEPNVLKVLNKKLFIPCPDDPEYLRKKFIPYIMEWSRAQKTVVMIPRYSPSCQAEVNKLPSEVKSELRFVELHSEIVPLSSQVFVTPIERAYYNLFCNDDISDVYTIARALAKLTMILGRPAETFAAGAVSTRVLKLLGDMQNNIGQTNFQENGAFSRIIILDRNVDKLSPFISSGNYANQIQEYYKPNMNFVKTKDGNIIDLSENDPIYTATKKMHISQTISYIKDRLKDTKNVTDNINVLREQAGTREFRTSSLRTAKIAQIKPFLEIHLDLIAPMNMANSLFINKFYCEPAVIECNPDLITEESILDLIRRREYTTAIKYLILRSYAGNGLPESLIKKVALAFSNYLGYKFYSEFMNLFESALIKQAKGIFEKDDEMKSSQVNDLLKITPSEDIRSAANNFFNDYIPLLVRFVEEALTNEWKTGTPGEKVLNGLKIPFIVQGNAKGCVPIQPEEKIEKPYHRVLVYVIGGITPAETEMLQEIGNIFYTDKNYTYQVHVASTSITSGDQIIESLCPSLNK